MVENSRDSRFFLLYYQYLYTRYIQTIHVLQTFIEIPCYFGRFQVKKYLCKIKNNHLWSTSVLVSVSLCSVSLLKLFSYLWGIFTSDMDLFHSGIFYCTWSIFLFQLSEFLLKFKITWICLPEIFNTKISRQLFYYKIALVNSQLVSTNSKGDLNSKTGLKSFKKVFLLYKNISDQLIGF